MVETCRNDHPPEFFREGHPPHHYPMPGGGRVQGVGVVKGGVSSIC